MQSIKDKPDLVIVGGMAMHLHGLKYSYADIDVVVNDLSGMYPCRVFDTKSAFSPSGKRALGSFGGRMVDIFINEELPEYQIIDGYKVATIPAMLAYFKDVLSKAQPPWHPYILERIAPLEAALKK